jgi:uncharacterized membrane protein (UPF0136 family)
VKSFAVEGLVFFLIVSALADVLAVMFPGSTFILLGVVFGFIHIVLAYFCWKQKTWSFLAAIVLALIIIIADITISGLQYPGDEILVILQTIIVFFSYRSYMENQLNKK